MLARTAGPERLYVQDLIAQMSRDQLNYSQTNIGEEKGASDVLLAAIVGLVGCPGFQRFWLGETVMGFLFLLLADYS